MSELDGNAPPSNPAAVISLIAGVLLCIPATGVIAIPAGAIGLLRARRIGGIGTKAARGGLILGIVNLVLYGAMFAGAYGTFRSVKLSQPTFEPTRKFIMLVGSGNVGGAKALCSDAIDEDKLTDTAEQIQKWGAIEKMNIASGGEFHSAADIEVSSELQFEKTSKIMVAHWANTDGSPRLTAYEFRDAPPAQPSTRKN